MQKRTLTNLIATLALLAATPVALAQGPLGTTNPGPDAAQVNGSLAGFTQDLHDVTFIGINGQNIPGRSTLWLVPGRYTLTVRITALNPRRGLFRRTHEEPGYNTIELVVAAGKTYDVRARYDRLNRRAPYSVVLHRVHD